jgi:hypothetical protein
VAVRALTAGGNGRELRPFWNVVFMAMRRDETTTFISWLCCCCAVWKGERKGEPPFKRFSNTDKKMAHVNKSIFP